MTETPRPDPWEDVGREIVGLGDLRMAERLLAVVNAARAADAARHQQEITKVCEFSREQGMEAAKELAQQAETIRQLQAEIADRTAATAKDAILIRRLDGEIATLTQERDEARAEATRNVLRYTVRGFTAGENADSKAWRARAEAAEARCATLTAALEFYANPFGRLDDFGDPQRVPDFYGEMDFGERARAALAAAPHGDKP